MHTLLQLISSIAAPLGLYTLYLLLSTIQSRITSRIKDLPGPPSKHWFWGNLKELNKGDATVLHEKWVEEYGRTMKYQVLLGHERLFTMDTKALNHILMNHKLYQKREVARYHLGRILGKGVLVTEGDTHDLQRKIMNPAFGPSQIRELTEIFVDKSVELRDVWSTRIANTQDGVVKINVLSSLSKMTLDVIGLAGFNYRFNAMKDKENGGSDELSKAFSVIFGDKDGEKIRIWGIIQSMVPFLRILPSQDPPEFKEAKETMARIGRKLLRESKEFLQGTGIGGKEIGEGKVKTGNWNSSQRDLLSLLVKSNMNGGEQGQRMSDEDVLAQVPTFLVAGHETTSTATAWALFALSKNPSIQHKLREELYTMVTDNPSMDQLNSLVYLDQVVRETLRVHAPVPVSMRVAMEDDVIPLGEGFVDKKGVKRDRIWVQKGQTIFIPILALNRDKSLWGEDSMEFKPERWDAIPSAVSSIPGVWGNMLTFLGGGRACVGYRFSLVEMKSLLFILLRSFEFELAVPVEDIVSRSGVVQRPMLKSNSKSEMESGGGGGSQLPLLVKLYEP
ncbi:cytochrome P450 [Lentinula guzmanii]|uniref:Cytochrome P450 n=1 Tax=Lentinula guzmanii TaxID=2804957 RepID=A0AA38J8A5_9AGAR|nr:cytochrome P450 [Lentinula guzmanii]